MAKLRAGRGAHATILTKYVKPPQVIPHSGHRSDIVLVDQEEKSYSFYYLADDNAGNEEAPILHASCRYVKVVSEGDSSLLFNKDKEPDIPWAKSKAKRLLYKEILRGDVPLESKYADNTSTMKLKDIYMMHPEYAEYKYEKFSGRLSSLRKTISVNQKRADDDQDAFDLFVQNNPISYYSQKGYIQWQGSESQRLLREDLRLGRVERNRKKELWMSRSAYHDKFPLKEF